VVDIGAHQGEHMTAHYPEFSGRTVVITGGAGGIGSATVRRFAAEGAVVFALDRDAAKLDQLAADASGHVIAIGIDLTDQAAVNEAAARAVSESGPLIAWVNYVGYYSEARAIDLTAEEFNKGLTLNLTSAFIGSQAAARQMIGNGGGAIVNTASNAGTRSSPRNPHYSAAKAGVIHLSRVLAAEWGSKGVRVNTIIPGYTRTPMIADMMANPDKRDALARATPLKRLGEPEDVADAVLFLCSDSARFVTGATLNADGGLMIG
jgi:NAD(P)-dependent dehydrogenase (short-subunit alcohol dehydrogenase family)